MSSKQCSKLILVELNEINFEIVEQYARVYPGRYNWLEQLLAGHGISTAAEEVYEQIEPWIQWVSVHSGMDYAEHQVFRLGDIVGSQVPQLFEKVEAMGVRVGCISPMNTENRLRRPAYFIPDPWTQTPSDGSWWSRELSRAVGQTVNDNSQSRVTVRSAFVLLLSVLRFARPRHYLRYIALARRVRSAPWRKALLLDLLLHDLHFRVLQTKKPGFSTIFLNAGAHVQHHYMFSAEPIKRQTSLRNPTWYLDESDDPIAEMLEVYDLIVGELLNHEGASIIFATGLTQQPYDRIKYYYRLREHAQFLSFIGIEFKSVHPRMTRDFLIEFETKVAALHAQSRLNSLRVSDNGLPLFGEIENRGTSLFVTLTYPEEIFTETSFELEGRRIPLLPQVAFVAIKNGMHQSKGFAFFTEKLMPYAPTDGSHVKHLHKTILRFVEAEIA